MHIQQTPPSTTKINSICPKTRHDSITLVCQQYFSHVISPYHTDFRHPWPIARHMWEHVNMLSQAEGK